jgi:glyoxylase I family protein
MEIAAIHHIALTVTDLDRSRKFYHEILSIEEIPRPPFNFPARGFVWAIPSSYT